jgi:hypothetical protein
MSRRETLTSRQKGRLSITEPPGKTGRHTQNELKTQATRPVGPGGGAKRGDRRDTHTLYTGNKKHAARGNTPRANVETRKS